MKKTKRLAVLLTAVLACGAMAFSACSNGDNNGGNNSGIIDNNIGNNNDTGNNDVVIQVTKDEWIERFAMFDNCDNITMYEGGYSRYPKDKAEEYGHWSSGGGATLFDFKSQIRCDILDLERYDPDDINAVNGFVKESYIEYAFCYNNHYFTWREDEGIYEISQEDFQNDFECLKETLQDFASFANEEFYEKATYFEPLNIYMFEVWNKYSEEYGTAFIQFLKNGGIKSPALSQEELDDYYDGFYSDYDDYYGEDIFYNINSTTVTVPAQAYKDADEYLAKKGE